MAIGEFLILDPRMPRSLAFCGEAIAENLEQIAREYGERPPAIDLAQKNRRQIVGGTIQRIMEDGLHETLENFIAANNALATQVERDYRFYE